MRPFKRPPVLLPHCSQCLHRTISTSATATRKRRNQRHIQKQRETELQERADIMRTRIHEARIARREDWILGPLAPRRDTEDNGYGTMSTRELHGMKGGLGRGVLTERGRGGVSTAGKKGKRNGKGKGVGMSWKESLIYRGDRVAVVSRTGPESREWGKIGVVEHVWRDRREVLVNGLNMVDIRTAPNAVVAGPHTPLIRPVCLPMPLSSVRLVHGIEDPETGIKTDKIISRLIPLPKQNKDESREELEAQNEGEGQERMERRKRRTIPGSKEVYRHWLEIPLPKVKAGKPKSNKNQYDGDSRSFEVEERTWTPTLLSAPMPGGVIDELRNKYSRFRTRHDAGYQLALDNRARRKAEYKAWAESGGGMLMTPKKEARNVEREKLKGRGEPTLEREVLERIGEVMARQGIEMTGKRRREVARNLSKEGMVKWGADVVPGKEMKAEGAVLDGDEEEEDDDGEEWELEGEEEEEEEIGKEDVLIEEDRPRGGKRPAL